VAAPGKQYVVLRDFSRTDQKTGDDVTYTAGSPYSGPFDASYLDPAGPDGKGPLIAEKSTSSPTPADSDSSSKEKS